MQMQLYTVLTAYKLERSLYKLLKSNQNVDNSSNLQTYSRYRRVYLFYVYRHRLLIMTEPPIRQCSPLPHEHLICGLIGSISTASQ